MPFGDTVSGKSCNPLPRVNIPGGLVGNARVVAGDARPAGPLLMAAKIMEDNSGRMGSDQKADGGIARVHCKQGRS